MPIPESWSSKLLSVLRFVAALTFMHHGTSKLLDFPPFTGPMNALTTVSGAFELIGGALLVIGLFTRPVAFILSGMMAVAYFMVHAPMGFFPMANHGEAAILYCFVFLYLAAAGGGAWSLDAQRGKP
jgi:putative oxidoreductase